MTAKRLIVGATAVSSAVVAPGAARQLAEDRAACGVGQGVADGIESLVASDCHGDSMVT